jgi:glycosyltransferase involved in cell wall biosynthesis
MAQADPPFQILQVNLQSDRGGDGRIVSALHDRYRSLGFPASLLVGRGRVTAESEDLLPNDGYRSGWARAWLTLAERYRPQDMQTSKVAKLLSWIAELNRRRRIHEGFEDFEFPATLPVISGMIRERPTILHLHNLHGGYFDLRALPALSHLTPVVLTLHDQWTFTGHCGYSFECERWRLGCGHCPDLTIYPGIPKDRTAENFILKREIFSRTRLYLTTPSRWLMNMAEQSLLAPAVEEARVIPNGVDTSLFHPGDKTKERSRLDLPRDSMIFLFAGSVARSDHQTDRRLLGSAIDYLRVKGPVDRTMVFLGSAQNSNERVDGVRIIHRTYEREISRVAGYYRASDIYLHLARADNYPTAVLESLACGLPVLATDVGGIPEQVKSLWASRNASRSPERDANGILVDADDIMSLGKALELLMLQKHLRGRLGDNGAKAAASEFSIIRQVERNLEWYAEILNRPRLSARSSEDTAARKPDLRQ